MSLAPSGDQKAQVASQAQGCCAMVSPVLVMSGPILLDLTPGKDDWVQLGRGFDQSFLKRAETTHVKLLLELPSTTIQALNYVDTSICEQCCDTFPSVQYTPMVHKQKEVLVSMVVDGSAPLTQLHFSPLDSTCVSGTGLEFLVAQLGDKLFQDFECKVIVELQFIENKFVERKPGTRRTRRAGIAIKAHSIFFAEVMEQTVAEYSQEQLQVFTSAALHRRLNGAVAAGGACAAGSTGASTARSTGAAFHPQAVLLHQRHHDYYSVRERTQQIAVFWPQDSSMWIKQKPNTQLSISYAEAVPGGVVTRSRQRRPTRREAELIVKELIEQLAKGATKQEVSLVWKRLKANLRSEDRLGMMENEVEDSSSVNVRVKRRRIPMVEPVVKRVITF